METVIIVIHLMVVLALVLVVLLQRSEGGALGMGGGGGGGGGGMMSARGSANILTRATAALAVVFFATSLGLAIIAKNGERPASILDAVPGAPTAPAGNDGSSGNGILDQIKPAPAPEGPQVPPAQ
ncbi:preprotein translocase subunit SecG [Stappia stellulata]|uniref:preprotein translocase subunit SecG n=1 Tax=Stappia stellulata TaxID=71235 RepID=UPI0004015093|nr:preprotein translocase subunit SecG [Stappia stellulata]